MWVANPKPDKFALAAAHVAGADGFLKCGGAHAIATLAQGIGPVPACNIIGIYVRRDRRESYALGGLLTPLGLARLGRRARMSLWCFVCLFFWGVGRWEERGGEVGGGVLD